MIYEEVDKHLIKIFPDFIIDEIDEELQYAIAGNFSLFLLEAFKNNSIGILILAGSFIEELHNSQNAKIRELATIGYLESIQNIWGNNSVDPEEMFKYLGISSKRWWMKLNEFWNGNIYALQEDIHDK